MEKLCDLKNSLSFWSLLRFLFGKKKIFFIAELKKKMLEREDSELDTVSGTDTDTAPVAPILIKQDVSLHLTETSPGSSALVSLVRNDHRQGSFSDGSLFPQLWRLGVWDRGAALEGLWWEPPCRFPDMEGCRDDSGGRSSLLISSQGCPSFRGGCSLTTSPNATDRPQAPLQHPRTEAKQNPGGFLETEDFLSPIFSFVQNRMQPPWPPSEFQRADSSSC